MDEKVFNLLEKVYIELQEVKGEVQGVKSEVREVKNDMIQFEQKMGEKIEGLFDGYKQNTEALKALQGSVERLEEKVDRHDIKIQVIEGGKRA